MRKKFLWIFIALFPLGVYAQYTIEVNDSRSLVRVGMNPHPNDSSDVVWACSFFNALEKSDKDTLSLLANYYENKELSDITKTKTYSSLGWLCRCIIQKSQGKEIDFPNLLSADLYSFFTKDDYKNLKEYLLMKYEINNYKPQSIKQHISQRTFFDDLLMFNDPYREKWDKTKTILSYIPFKPDDVIVDVGCGFGYNSLLLADHVSEKGKVYATDIEEQYVKYLSTFLQKNNIHNVIPVLAESTDLSVNDSVDIVFMSSLYHIIYTWSREDERYKFLSSIKQRLKEGGYLVIVDNNNLGGKELNNCHVDKRLVEAQLSYWGFKLVSSEKISEQRYFLMFKHVDKNILPTGSGTLGEIVKIDALGYKLPIISHKSIIHIGSLDSYDITDRGIEAAKYVYDYFDKGIKEFAETAIDKYNIIIQQENFGGEYSALQWLCEASLATGAKKDSLLKNPLSKSFYDYLVGDGCKYLKYYLMHKYKLGSEEERMNSDSLLEINGEVGRTKRSFLDDYILGLNPRRVLWEQTDSIMNNLDIKEDEVVADIGSGSGFYTYRFSDCVGAGGKVYAVEIKDEHIERLNDFIQKNMVSNVKVIKGDATSVELPEKADKIFLCSLYHIFYGVLSDEERGRYLRSLIKYLKPDGELIIVDNSPVDNNTLPYHGPYISKELVECQLAFYGFRLSEYKQVTPQRYVLKFKFTNP